MSSGSLWQGDSEAAEGRESGIRPADGETGGTEAPGSGTRRRMDSHRVSEKCRAGVVDAKGGVILYTLYFFVVFFIGLEFLLRWILITELIRRYTK